MNRQGNRQNAERITAEYLKPVYGFALKRCKSIQDAEDLSQEIMLKVFRAFLVRDDIEDAGKFIWTIAHNALSNYYRDAARSITGIDPEEAAEWLAAPDQEAETEDYGEFIPGLRKEIARLSRLQRRIVVAYYFENRRQADIARELELPLGTVKWHLFEAKKELKRGMDTMRKTGELTFNPVRFDSIGWNGSIGTKSEGEFFHSVLNQNICYCVRNRAKTVNEIAEELGVSPVYVEGEAEFLEEYGFLKQQKDRYLVNFLISEPTAELLVLQNDMYAKASKLYANDLYDELVSTGILEDAGIVCRQSGGEASSTESGQTDYNFLLWSLIPYIAAWSGEDLIEKKISFEEAATVRPDGGQNIVVATVVPDHLVLPEDYVYLNQWNGPMWNGSDSHILWQVDSQWSDRGERNMNRYSEEAGRVLSLYEREGEEKLSKDEYAWLAERGYVKTNGNCDGQFRAQWQIVVLENREIRDRLLALGEQIKRKYREEFEALKAPYAEAVLESVPAHLKKMKAYELQYVFHADGWFLRHCVETLLRNGKLKEPGEGQKKALSTMIIPR